MSVKNLDKLFKPQSVAVIGASNRDGSIGALITRNLFHQAGVPTHNTPEQVVTAFMHMVDYRRNQDMRMETPRSVSRTPCRRRKASMTFPCGCRSKRQVRQSGCSSSATPRGRAKAVRRSSLAMCIRPLWGWQISAWW